MNRTDVINILYAPKWFERIDGNQNGFVYIGRPHTFGNPIEINKVCPVCRNVHKAPASTLDCYKMWLDYTVKTNDEFRDKVISLYGKTLVCHCKPNRCHGDILKQKMLQLRGVIEEC